MSTRTDSFNNAAGTFEYLEGDEHAERFEVVLTTTERDVVMRICDTFERSGLPVMIQHVELHATLKEGKFSHHAAYRVLVPSQLFQTASQFIADRVDGQLLN